MGSVDPGLGRGISRAGEAIFQALITRGARKQQARQLDINERTAAVNAFSTLLQHLPPGTTLADLGAGGGELFTSAFNIPAEEMLDLELRPETFQTIFGEMMKGELQTNPDIGELILPSIRAQAGLEPSEDVQSARDLQGRMEFGALSSILDNPAFVDEFVRRTLGQNPVSMSIPGVEGTFDFDSPTAANIYAQFLLASERNTFDLRIADTKERKDLIQEIQKAVLESDVAVSSTAIEGRVIPVYNEAIETGDSSKIAAFLNDPKVSEGEKLAMQFIVGSVQTGEFARLQGMPPSLQNFLRIGSAIRTVLSPEDTERVMQSITPTLKDAGVDVGVLENPIFGGMRLNLGQAPGEPGFGPGPQPGAPVGPQGLQNFPPDILAQTATELLAEGVMTREQIAEMGLGDFLPPEPTGEITDIGGIPPDGIDPASVSTKLQPAARALNLLIVRRNESTRASEKLSLDNRIAVLRAKLEGGK